MENKNRIKIDIDTSAIEKATKKVDELVTKLKECIELIHQLSNLTK
ncbi:MAG: hypothetical protein IJ790_00710 [Lachnospiraceae bacterium]|nr:hypothetical protein [Lachnospiraceae bacterium]